MVSSLRLCLSFSFSSLSYSLVNLKICIICIILWLGSVCYPTNSNIQQNKAMNKGMEIMETRGKSCAPDRIQIAPNFLTTTCKVQLSSCTYIICNAFRNPFSLSSPPQSSASLWGILISHFHFIPCFTFTPKHNDTYKHFIQV